MAAAMAREFELFDQSLIILNINKGDYVKVISLITALKDDATKCKQMAKYSHVLLKHSPKLMIETLRQPSFDNINKLELIPALMTMENFHHTLMAAADYVEQVWIERLGLHERQYYNLAFQLNLRSLVASRTLQETAESNRL
jgi:hypothetical protein